MQPNAAETLYESEHTRVSRVRLGTAPDSGTVIRKEPLGPDSPRRLRHELAILERLVGAPGICSLAPVPSRVGSLQLVDVDGVPLRTTPTPWIPAAVARVGAALARALTALHERGVIHTEINPGNVLLAPGGTPWLIDFDRALDGRTETGPAETGPAETGPSWRPQRASDLVYQAPEQTGRTGHPIDDRADLYGLGATLYHLATGRAPFASADPLRLSHDRLARMPPAPAQLNAAVPRRLSDLIMRLLEKEPDRRYQTAEGLAYDLLELAGPGPPGSEPFGLGQHDFPVRLTAPSRLVGRDREIAELAAAFTDSITGRCRGVLVSGPPGIGKSSLINELRPIVAAHGGRFVTGKFDQHRQDLEYDAVRQALRALGRLLLAEPEEEIAELRKHILDRLGANAALVAAILPEFEVLLGVAGDATMDDPRSAQARLQQAGLELVRAVASPQRPLVIVLDDLQWAQRTPLGFMDAAFTAVELDGLLLVGAYRDGAIGPAHPFGAVRSRWEELGVAPRDLPLTNLPATNLAALLAQMLRLDQDRAAELAAVIEPRTRGNPFDTVELVNALRRDGALRQGDGGWQWNPSTVRRQLDRTDATDPIAARAAALPSPTRTVLENLACLGGQVDVRLMRAATGLAPTELRRRLAPAVDDGLLVSGPGSADGATINDGASESVRFQHDRIQESLLNHIEPGRRRAMRLGLARGLASDPALVAVAAEQFLPVADMVSEPAERHRVVGVLRAAADQATMMCYYGEVERLLSAALKLYDGAEITTLVQMETGRLEALYSLGRLTDADEVFHRIDRLTPDPLVRADAILVQVSSLTNRGRLDEALALGLAQLDRLGLTVPPPERLDEEIDQRLAGLYQWADGTDPAYERDRPESQDPLVLATAAVVNRLMPPAFYGNRQVMQWLCLEAIALWVRHGPNSQLAGPVSHVMFAAVPLRQDYRVGYRAGRLVLATCEARGYHVATALSRFLYGVGSGHWFSSLEDNVQLVQRAREDLVRGGDLQNGCYSYYIPVHQFLEYAPTLHTYAVEVESAVTFAVRTGNTTAALAYGAYRQLVRDLRGESDGVGRPMDEPAADPNTVANIHLTRALSAALLRDAGGLARHLTKATALLPYLDCTYPTALVNALRALSLSDQLRTAADPDPGIQAELDEVIDWLAGRARDAPGNFQHLRRLAEAERDWARGDFQAASSSFDAAQREVVGRARPWHQALIQERAGRFQLAYGLESAAAALLGEARRGYQAWGAVAKVIDLDREFPGLSDTPRAARAGAGATRAWSAGLATNAIDLLGVLAASRALSSEKTLDGLRTRVVDVLSAMTGATTIHFVLWNEDTRSELPGSAVRYVERTQEPLVVADAVHDDRFANDPYFVGLDRCSLLVVPILNRGRPQALLMLENRLIRSAFSPDHLDGVMLIAGQLAVSLDNALIYASLERKVAERTQELAVANERLERLSVTDPLTGLANRRRLADVLEDRWRQAVRSGQSIGVAMVDVDHFKAYNDHFGHLAGDECLRVIATELARNVRETDLVARFGGEEFAVVLPNSDDEAAGWLAERLRAAIVDLGRPLPRIADGIVTVSIGVAATGAAPPATAAALLAHADRALYRAKRRGRNRVELA